MKHLLTLLFVVLSVIVYCNDPYFTEENVNTFIERLGSEGFIVQQGTFNSFDMPDLFSNYITPSCYGNNSNTPYCVYYMPPAPSQTAKNTFPFTFRLMEDVAVVFLGWTPPEVKYFSYETLLMFRYLPYVEGPVRIFGGVGDM
ncbi:hypothetical protein [Mesotoga sp. B105.6.4]|uniref:hypothetical protein n=1 Tax=Mesotoga sp. B105.6.4 TaxID=1582224 RepID=UPI000CCBF10C|nr:hypothetical protein [Mesotoga sp. B105.6.4]